jgi:hypothetical protein
MNEDQKTAQRMRRQAKRDSESLTEAEQFNNLPANYLPPSVINSISSVKQAKVTFDKLISRELIDMIANGETQTIKLKAMDMYHKLSSSAQMLIKHGNNVAAIEAPTGDTGATINVNFSSHLQSDEPEETLKIASRDLVAEKNEKLFSETFAPEGQSSPVRADIEDAEFEVING